MPQDYFFLIFFITILVTRIFLFLKPTPSPTVLGFRFHHWMYGIALILLSLIFKNVVVFAIGLGLFVDELTYILIRGKNHEDNYSVKSLAGTVIFIILVYAFQSDILSLLM